MEYPGYGLYTGYQPNEEQILADIESVLDYSVNILGFLKENIVVVGRLGLSREVNRLGAGSPYHCFVQVMRPHTHIALHLLAAGCQELAAGIGCPDVREGKVR